MPLKTTMQMDVWHGKTGPGVLKAWTVLAIVSHLGGMGMWHPAMLPHLGVERRSVLDALQWLGAPSTALP